MPTFLFTLTLGLILWIGRWATKPTKRASYPDLIHHRTNREEIKQYLRAIPPKRPPADGVVAESEMWDDEVPVRRRAS